MLTPSKKNDPGAFLLRNMPERTKLLHEAHRKGVRQQKRSAFLQRNPGWDPNAK